MHYTRSRKFLTKSYALFLIKRYRFRPVLQEKNNQCSIKCYNLLNFIDNLEPNQEPLRFKHIPITVTIAKKYYKLAVERNKLRRQIKMAVQNILKNHKLYDKLFVTVLVHSNTFDINKFKLLLEKLCLENSEIWQKLQK